MEVYFDNAATTMVREEAAAAMNRVMLGTYGNPSSTHKMGRRAAGELTAARRDVAAALGAQPDELFFTSGGTEADNWAAACIAGDRARKGRHIITSLIEHDAVINPIKELEKEGWSVTYLSPDSAGRVPVEDFAEALRDDTVFASIMLVNNETGAVNPVDGYAREIKRRKLVTLLHTDAVQGFCKIPFHVKTLGADLVSVSAHKIHGPKGIGALYVRKGVKLRPLFLGGGQESGKRAGTEALPSASGFAEAARLGRIELEETARAAGELREYTIRRLAEEIPGVVFIGGGNRRSGVDRRGDTNRRADTNRRGIADRRRDTDRRGGADRRSGADQRGGADRRGDTNRRGDTDQHSDRDRRGDPDQHSDRDRNSDRDRPPTGFSPFILSLSLPGYKGEVLVNYLDGEGICVSRSAACKKGGRSRVLEAMKLKNEVVDGALRASFSRYSTIDEAEYFVRTLSRAAQTLLKPL